MLRAMSVSTMTPWALWGVYWPPRRTIDIVFGNDPSRPSVPMFDRTYFVERAVSEEVLRCALHGPYPPEWLTPKIIALLMPQEQL